MREVVCLGCRARSPSDDVLDRVRAGEDDPACRACGGILKMTTVSFGEMLPQDVLAESYRRAEASDLCLVVGSSLVVYPAADVPLAAARAGARLAIVNQEATPMDSLADPVVRGRAGEVLGAAVAGARRALAPG
jgi:NAD-dependent deacetylase